MVKEEGKEWKGVGREREKDSENTVRHSLVSFLAPMDTAEKELCGPIKGRAGGWQAPLTGRLLFQALGSVPTFRDLAFLMREVAWKSAFKCVQHSPHNPLQSSL